MKFFSQNIKRAGWLFEQITWPFLAIVYRNRTVNEKLSPLSIGITTFKARYIDFLKPLLKKTAILFPGTTIIVVANGDVDRQAQEAYIKELEQFVKEFRNVKLISFTEPKGLSVLWNTIIDVAETQGVLILNDDLKLKKGFRNFIQESGLTGNDFATINSSFSHFFISKDIVKRVGWFDEGFIEIGGEDDDYLARMAISGEMVGNFSTGSIAKSRPLKSKPLEINSYGKKISEQKGGYSTADTIYLRYKWEISDVPIPGGVHVPQRNNTYWKLRPEYHQEKNHSHNS